MMLENDPTPKSTGMPVAMHWDDVATFLTLAREGSLSGAARELGVKHATVSRRMDRLESALGQTLFKRQARGWSPTAEAEALRNEAERMEQAARAFAALAAGTEAVVGPLRLSAPPLLQAALLAPLIAGLMKQDPALDLFLDGEDDASALSADRTDIALRIGAPEGTEVSARKLADLAYRPYRTGDTEAVILSERSEGEAALWMRDWALGRKVALHAAHTPSLLAMARAGAGIALLPSFLARSYKELQPVGRERLLRPLYLAYRSDRADNPRILHVAERLEEAVKGLSTILG